MMATSTKPLVIKSASLGTRAPSYMERVQPSDESIREHNYVRIFVENTEAKRAYVNRRKWQPRLVIDHQSFDIGWPDGLTKRECDWVRRQLSIALYRFKYGEDYK